MSGLRAWNSKAGRSMLAGFTAGLLLLLALAVPADELPQVGRLVPGIHTRALRVGDRERRYRVCVPRSYDGQKAVPVVLVFHGGGGDPDGMMKLCGMNAKAEQAGFIAVYPYGTGRFAGRLLSFNGGECCGYAHDNSIDDVGFVRALLDDLAAAANVDADRIFATGLSNGGIMSHYLASELSDRIAAIAPVGGPLMLEKPDISANDLMWEFFQRHPRTGVSTGRQKGKP